MNICDALEIELKSIPEFSNRVFPLITMPKTDAPFCVYQKVNVKFHKVLSGTLNNAEGIFNVIVLTKSYVQLQDLSDVVTNKLLSFFDRKIGDIATGIYISGIDVELTGELYETENEYYRANIQLKISY